MAKSKRPGSEPPPPPPPLRLETTPQFDRDAKRQEKRGKAMETLAATIEALRTHRRLPPSHRDHALKGDWKGFRECHVGGEGDWLLVYVRDAGRLILFRTGTHEEIF